MAGTRWLKAFLRFIICSPIYRSEEVKCRKAFKELLCDSN